MKKVPKSLQVWFVIHFIVDIVLAIPLIFFPVYFFNLLGLELNQIYLARVLGAGLVGIGSASLFAYNKSKESYDILLTLKIFWSITAASALIYSVFVEGAPEVLLWFVRLFIIFSGVWIYYKFFRK